MIINTALVYEYEVNLIQEKRNKDQVFSNDHQYLIKWCRKSPKHGKQLVLDPNF